MLSLAGVNCSFAPNSGEGFFLHDHKEVRQTHKFRAHVDDQSGLLRDSGSWSGLHGRALLDVPATERLGWGLAALVCNNGSSFRRVKVVQ